MSVPARRRGPARLKGVARRRDDHPHDKRWGRIKSFVIQRDMGKCVACGHWGADGIDHVIPRSECAVRGISPYDPSNLAAIHHSQPCPECAQAAAALGNKAGHCNQLKGSGSLERARQLISNRTGLTIYGVIPTGIQRNSKAPSKPADDNYGEREW